MVLVGGATRLTESGLSITEWKPVMGVVPPLSENAWQAAFEKYQAIPQYRELNSGMSLAEFKTIYWWEWTHRLLGRVIGAAYLLPFLWFLWRGWVGAGAAPAAVVHFRARRAAGRRRLVDGRVRSRRSRRGLAISAGDASPPGLPDLCRADLDGVADGGACDGARARAHPCRRFGVARSRPGANLSRRAGRRIARRLCLQYLAADRRRVDARPRRGCFSRRRCGAISSRIF